MNLIVNKIIVNKTQTGLDECGAFAGAFVNLMCQCKDSSHFAFDQRSTRALFDRVFDEANLSNF